MEEKLYSFECGESTPFDNTIISVVAEQAPNTQDNTIDEQPSSCSQDTTECISLSGWYNSYFTMLVQKYTCIYFVLLEITVAELEGQVIDLKKEINEMKQKAKTMQEDIHTLKTLNFTNEELPPPILPHELSIPYFQQLSTDMTSQIPTTFPLISYPPILPRYSTPVKPIPPH